MAFPNKHKAFRLASLVVFNMGTTLVILFLLEVYVRLAHPDIQSAGIARNLVIDPGYGSSARLRPGATGRSDGVLFTVDDLGFWQYSAKLDTALSDWLLLGDSVTMGIGVDPDSTFAGKLARVCSRFRILNPSWVGYSSADYIAVASAFLHDKTFPGLTAKIQHVTVCWTLNDVYSSCTVGLPPGTTVRNYGSTFLVWLKQHYRTYIWLKSIFFDRPKDYFEFDRKFYQKDDPHLVAALADLDSLKRLCATAGVDLDVMFLPYEYQLRPGNKSSLVPQAIVFQALDSLGIRYYDTTPIFTASSLSSKSLYRFGDGIHFSSRGHDVLFNYLHKIFCNL